MSEAKADIRSAITIRRWADVDRPELLTRQLDAIFFEASGTKTFASEAAREAFRERWFARYLMQHPQWAYVAMAADGTLAGYLVGALDEGSGFDDFAAVTDEFPAHLHVNLAPVFRSRGIGADLIEAFAEEAARPAPKGCTSSPQPTHATCASTSGSAFVGGPVRPSTAASWFSSAVASASRKQGISPGRGARIVCARHSGMTDSDARPVARRLPSADAARLRAHPLCVRRNALHQSRAGPYQHRPDAGRAAVALDGDALLAGDGRAARRAPHACFARLYKLPGRATLRLPRWELVQILLGISIPFLLLPHIINTRIAHVYFNVNDIYVYELARLWPASAIIQSLLLVIVWVHGCMGIHFWLRLYAPYRRIFPLLLTLAVIIPLAALGGFAVAGSNVAAAIEIPSVLANLKVLTRWPERSGGRDACVAAQLGAHRVRCGAGRGVGMHRLDVLRAPRRPEGDRRLHRRPNSQGAARADAP